MKITTETRFITNGEVYIRLGFYAPGTHPDKKHNGEFHNCKDYPRGAAGHYLGGGRMSVFESWIRDKDGYMRDFIGINYELIPEHILAALQYDG